MIAKKVVDEILTAMRAFDMCKYEQSIRQALRT